MPRRNRAYGIHTETGRAKGNKRRTPCRNRTRRKRYADRQRQTNAKAA